MNITLDRNSYSFVLFTKTKRSAKNEKHSIPKQEDFEDIIGKHELIVPFAVVVEVTSVVALLRKKNSKMRHSQQTQSTMESKREISPLLRMS